MGCSFHWCHPCAAKFTDEDAHSGFYSSAELVCPVKAMCHLPSLPFSHCYAFMGFRFLPIEDSELKHTVNFMGCSIQWGHPYETIFTAKVGINFADNRRSLCYIVRSRTQAKWTDFEVEVNLRTTVSRPVSLCVSYSSGTRDQFFFLLEISFRQLRAYYFVAPSLTRRRICTLLYNCFWAMPDSPNLEGQVPVIISPRNRVAQLYPRALGSLFFLQLVLCV
jgi:hypothetical protein